MNDRELLIKIREILYQHELDSKSSITDTCRLGEELVTLFKGLQMEKIILTPEQKNELKVIKDYFLESVEPIEDTYLQSVVSAKICSRIGALADRLVTRPTDV